MPGIQCLSESMISKIAAGEVIERPASVAKELVENALDAGAERIRVESKDGGRQLLLVSDDGSGMSRADAELSVVRHATSKMAQPSDLFAIETLGFRGEALAAIGAVSRLRIRTRSASEQEGTEVVVEGGVRRTVATCGRAPGTSVEVHNLFFNTPARRKFLRQNSTELRHITQQVIQLSAASPGVGFQLVHDGRSVLHMLPGDPRQRAAELLGVDADELLCIEHAGDDGIVSGFLAPAERQARGRGQQYLMIRGRPVVAQVLSQAVRSGYGGLLKEEARPAFVIWLDLDPSRIDVNVHPTKREIRLEDEEAVAATLELAVRMAVRGSAALRAEAVQPGSGGASLAREGDTPRALSLVMDDEPSSTHVPMDPDTSGQVQEVNAKVQEAQQDVLQLTAAVGDLRLRGSATTDVDLGKRLGGALGADRRAWQLHGEFIFVQAVSGVLVVDQHAAHARVLYERALAFSGDTATVVQQLLFPKVVRLSPDEMEAVRTALDELTALGFGVRPFGADTVLLESVPAGIQDADEDELFRNLVAELLTDARNRARRNPHRVAAAYAEAAAVARGQRLTDEEVRQLLDDLARTEEPFRCPHGRATVVQLTTTQIRQLLSRASASKS